MRISGITLPENKQVPYALAYIYGIGISLGKQLAKKAKINLQKKVKDLTVDEENSLRKEIESLKIEGDLRREISQNIKRHKDIKTYRGIRHMRSLPVRGQRTKTNSRTVRGNVRKTMSSGRKKADIK